MEEGSGQYLAPEPLLQEPQYVASMASSGMAVPAYAYALNNPVNVQDPNGAWPIQSSAYNQCWAECVERNSLGNAVPAMFGSSQSFGNAGWQSILFSAWPKRILPPFRVPFPSQTLTTPISSAVNVCGGATKVPFGHAIRAAGGMASNVATPITVFQGFYSWGSFGVCAQECYAAGGVGGVNWLGPWGE